jgi:hypothetical protein
MFAASRLSRIAFPENRNQSLQQDIAWLAVHVSEARENARGIRYSGHFSKMGFKHPESETFGLDVMGHR